MRLAGWLWLLLATGVAAEPVSFGLFGDTPYGRRERAELPRMLQAMDREDLAFVVHDGDIKSGASPCTDQVFQDIRQIFEQSAHPLIYIPGDNEWTDCHRLANGGYDPLERLQALRRILFGNDRALGRRPLPLVRQSPDYPENVRWQAGDYLFLGLNIPGSNNNRGDDDTPRREYLDRSQANRRWLAEAFALAREQRRAGLFVIIQGNPFEAPSGLMPRPDGYRAFIDQLRRETQSFNGEVVLVHGDTHRQRIDHPLTDGATGRPLANFTRVETYGSPFMGWIKVTADAAAEPRLPFEPSEEGGSARDRPTAGRRGTGDRPGIDRRSRTAGGNSGW
jgi:hypothetical protein